MSIMFSKAIALIWLMGVWHAPVSAVMLGMFYQAAAFNRPTGVWDTSAVVDMNITFHEDAALFQLIPAECQWIPAHFSWDQLGLG